MPHESGTGFISTFLVVGRVKISVTLSYAAIIDHSEEDVNWSKVLFLVLKLFFFNTTKVLSDENKRYYLVGLKLYARRGVPFVIGVWTCRYFTVFDRTCF